MKTRNQRISEEIEAAGAMYGGVLKKAFDGASSPRSAIKAMCLHCVGYRRVDVTNCTGYACPLWMYRPYQDDKAGEEVATTPS
jgi:hypothetical protein